MTELLVFQFIFPSCTLALALIRYNCYRAIAFSVQNYEQNQKKLKHSKNTGFCNLLKLVPHLRIMQEQEEKTKGQKIINQSGKSQIINH